MKTINSIHKNGLSYLGNLTTDGINSFADKKYLYLEDGDFIDGETVSKDKPIKVVRIEFNSITSLKKVRKMINTLYELHEERLAYDDYFIQCTKTGNGWVFEILFAEDEYKKYNVFI
jgi:hypothetical protein